MTSNVIADVFPTLKNVSAEKSLALATNALCMVDHYEEKSDRDGALEALKKLKDELLYTYGIRIGEFVGAGQQALVFNIVGPCGDVMEKSVIRIEANHLIPSLNNPAIIKPILKVNNKDYMAIVVPRAQKKAYKKEELLTALRCINHGEGNLDQLQDLEPGQFSEMAGMPIPVLTDLNAVGVLGKKGFTQLDRFLELQGMARHDIISNPIDHKEFLHLKELQNRIHKAAREELLDKRVTLIDERAYRR